MRILMAHNAYARPSGEEHAARAIGQLLEQRGHHVRWFWRSSADIRPGWGNVQAFFSGIHSFRARREMTAELRQSPVDLVQVQNLYPLLSPSILQACRQQNIPVVMRCPNYRLFCPTGLHLSHGQVCERCLGGREWWCLVKNCDIGGSRLRSFSYAVRSAWARWSRAIVDNVDLFLVLSQFQRARFVRGGIAPARIHVVPNLAPVIDSDIGDELGDKVSFVGRVSPEKGIDDFLAAAAQLPDIPFAVAGSYETMPHLVASSPANVQWLGFQDEARLNALYRRSRLLVFPSRWFEGFPNVITRAMRLGKPVVASRIGGLPEIVEHEQCGLLFEPGNVQQLVQSVRDLYHSPERCRAYGAAGRAKADAQYSADAVYHKLMAGYQSVWKPAQQT